MLPTMAAVAARATVRAAVRYGRRRILMPVTGGITLADILLHATTKEAPKLPQETVSVPVLVLDAALVLRPVEGEGYAFLPAAGVGTVRALSMLDGTMAGVAENRYREGTRAQLLIRRGHEECKYEPDRSRGTMTARVRGFFPVAGSGIEVLLFPEFQHERQWTPRAAVGLASHVYLGTQGLASLTGCAIPRPCTRGSV